MTSDETFQTGDIVRPRNGGPAMTIEATSERFAFCTWLDTHGHLLSDTFPQASLGRVAELRRSRGWADGEFST
jgi:uncharacterized protein YodC (DUF2158 family)